MNTNLKLKQKLICDLDVADPLNPRVEIMNAQIYTPEKPLGTGRPEVTVFGEKFSVTMQGGNISEVAWLGTTICELATAALYEEQI